MNEDKDKLDNLFRKGLEDPVDQAGYQEADWGSLEQMLDKHKKRRGFIYWLPVLSSAAALLLFFGWWAFRPTPVKPQQNQNVSANHINSANAVKSNGQKLRPDSQQPIAKPAVATPSAPTPHVPVSAASDLREYAKNNKKRATDTNKPELNMPFKGSAQDRPFAKIDEVKSNRLTETLAAVNEMPVFESGPLSATVLNSFDIPQTLASRSQGIDRSKKEKNKIKMNAAYHQQLALTFLAAPDISGVGSFQQNKLGTNFGLLFTGGLIKKLTISTGVVYSVKPYLTGFENYHTKYKFPTNPDNVSAECRMLDIPVNLGYQLYHKNLNTISFGTGLSSYIMVDQKYQFNYSDPYTVGPKKFDVAGNDKYIFEILNLSATYQHQLNSKVSLSVQPYFKLPLANIGYSDVRLQTTGVALGLTWNLNSLSNH